MHRYHIYSPEKEIADLLESDHSAERSFFNIKIHQNELDVDPELGPDIVAATKEFWDEHKNLLDLPGCKVCMCDHDICSFFKKKGMYQLKPGEIKKQHLLTYITSLYRNYLVDLSYSEEWKVYYKALSSEPNPIIITDNDGIIHYMNAKAELEFNVRLKNFRGVLFQSLFTISSQNDDRALSGLVDFYSEPEISRSFREMNMILPTGIKHPYSVYLNRMDLDNLADSPVKINLIDATHLKNVEDELQLKEAAIEQTQNGILITNSDFSGDGPYIEYVNPKMLEITGYEREELLGKNPRIFQGPKTDRKKLQNLKKTIKNGESYSASAINYRKDGSEYFVDWNISPIQDKDGQISHYVSIQQDKTEEVKRTAQLQRLATIIDHSSSYVFTFSEDGRILSINKSASDLIGYNESDVKGSQILNFLESDNFEVETLKEQLKTQEALNYQNLVIHTSAEKRIIANVRIYYLNSKHEDSLLDNYIALVIDDVTEKQRANRVLENASEQASVGGWEFEPENGLIYLSNWTAKEFQFNDTTITLNHFLKRLPTSVQRLLTSGGESETIEETFKVEETGRYYKITGQNERGSKQKDWHGLIQDVTKAISLDMLREWRKQITEKIARGFSTEKIYADINSFIEVEIADARSVLTFFKENYVHDVYTNSLEEYRQAILNSKVIPGAGPCSEAFCKQKPVVAPYIYKIDRWSLFHQLAKSMEVVATWSYPVIVLDEVVATIALFFKTEREPVKEENYVIETVQQIIQLLAEREVQRKDLIETKQKLEKAQKIAGIGDWIMNIEEEVFSAVSVNIVNMFELNENDKKITLDSIFEKIYEADREFVQDAIREAIFQKNSFSVTYRLGPLSDGRLKYLNTIGEYADSNQGPILRGISQDVTESKNAEEKLMESLDMWSSLVNTLPNPLIIINGNTIEFLNPSAQEMLGVEDDVLDSSMSLQDYVIDDDLNQVKRFINSDDSDAQNNIQISLTSKKGDVKHVIMRSANIVYEGKNHKQLVLSDITSLVHTQAELQKVRDNLEIGVAERTEELTAKNEELQHEIEKRKKVEEELLYTSLQLSTIFNNTNQIFILLDSDFRILSFNERAAQWAEKVVKKPLTQRSRFDEYDTLGISNDMFRKFNDALNGITSQTERMFDQEDGKTRWAQVEYIPVREKGDELTDKVLFVATDITNRKQVEIELRDSKKLLESINEHVSQGIFRLTEDHWFYANKALLNLLEVSDIDELDSSELSHFFNSAGSYETILQKIIEHEGIENQELQLKNTSGKVIDVLVSAFVNNDSEGGIDYVDGTVTDITERKESELKLRESEERYRNLYENMSQGVIYHSNDGSILSVNDAACRILGQSRDQLLGVTPLDPQWKVLDINGEPVTGDKHPVMKAFAQGEPVFNDMIAVHRPHHKDFRWINVHAQPHIDEMTGKPLSAVVTFEDITPLKMANEKVEEARRQTEQMARAKEQFLANMSHEIRTPMSGIKGMAYLLNRTNLDEDQKLYVKNIIESSQNLLVIINDILDISKIESGKISFEHSAFSIRNVVDSVTDMMRVQVGEHIEIVSIVDEYLPEFVVGDSSRLNQILFNLVGNAVKFTDEGYVTVKAEVEKMAKKSLEVKISIEDTGIGISPQKIDTIFELFTQADDSSTKKYRGTGLGLHITKRLIEMQGGSIEVVSEPGVGSLFTVFLPFKIEESVRINDVSESEQVDLQNIEVLVVDDNAVNALWAEKLLAKWNVRVDTVTGGMQAIEFLKTNDVDIILMDIQMPEMNGYETTQFIRKNLSDYADTPIIGVTADVLRNQLEKCRQAGMDSYLAKPYEPEQMLKILTKYVNKRSE